MRGREKCDHIEWDDDEEEKEKKDNKQKLH